eukprot:g74708.t1
MLVWLITCIFFVSESELSPTDLWNLKGRRWSSQGSAPDPSSPQRGRPNIIFILTDDQDVSSMEVMSNTNELLAAGGTTFSNAFAAVPVCCPSRASILTGQHAHNTKVTGNTIGSNCSSASWRQGGEMNTYAVHLQRAGYWTAYWGKYLNKYGEQKDEADEAEDAEEALEVFDMRKELEELAQAKAAWERAQSGEGQSGDGPAEPARPDQSFAADEDAGPGPLTQGRRQMLRSSGGGGGRGGGAGGGRRKGRRAHKKGESTDQQVFNPKQHIPPGWDHWVAQVGKVSYFNYELNRNGQVEEHGDEGDADYLSTLMRVEAIRKINNWAKTGDPRPLFMQLSFTSPHDPIEPEPKHTNKFLDMQAPRYPSFNFGPKDRLAWISASTPLSQHQISYVDLHYIKRLQMLMSVDQAVRDIGRALNDVGELDNTYIVYTSDHGFHHGMFQLLYGKETIYDLDTRVPLLIRGPGVAAGRVVTAAVSLVDLFPTFLEMAGLQTSDLPLDGLSLLPWLQSQETGEPTHWRTHVLVQHWGSESTYGQAECKAPFSKLGIGVTCLKKKTASLSSSPPYYQGPPHICSCTDSDDNTYWCDRSLEEGNEYLYCKFANGHTEFYWTDQDPYQLSNLANGLDPDFIQRLTDGVEVMRTSLPVAVSHNAKHVVLKALPVAVSHHAKHVVLKALPVAVSHHAKHVVLKALTAAVSHKCFPRDRRPILLYSCEK